MVTAESRSISGSLEERPVSITFPSEAEKRRALHAYAVLFGVMQSDTPKSAFLLLASELISYSEKQFEAV